MFWEKVRGEEEKKKKIEKKFFFFLLCWSLSYCCCLGPSSEVARNTSSLYTTNIVSKDNGENFGNPQLKSDQGVKPQGQSVRVWSLVPQIRLFHFTLKEFLQAVGTFVVVCVGLVVCTAIGENAIHIGYKQALIAVITILQALTHRLQVWKENKENK